MSIGCDSRLARRTAALCWLGLFGVACAGRPATGESSPIAPVASGSDHGANDVGVVDDRDAGAPAPPAVTFTRLGCIFEGKRYSQYDTFTAGERVCGCHAGTVSCRPLGTRECYARGQWTRPGEWGPARDGCNSMRCPSDTQPAAVTLKDCRVVIPSVVPFSPGSAQLSEDARKLVAAVAEVMKTLPTLSDERPTRIVLVEVQGHASADERKPKELAQARADAVRDALVQAGVPPAFLRAVGYGADRPIAPSTSPSARASNRRVEFSLVEAPALD